MDARNPTPDGQVDETVDVFVTVGTDHHPFDRLVQWADELARQGRSVVVQFGTSRAPSVAIGHDYLPIERLEALMGRATAVVTHGGPATIMQARDLGVVPIVVARDPDRGEHVDGHQMRFARRLADLGTVVAGQDADSFAVAVERVLADPSSNRCEPHSTKTDETVRMIGDLIETLVATRRGQSARVQSTVDSPAAEGL